MAMNKKELKQLEDALTKAALRWTNPVLPDLEISKTDELQIVGFTFNSHSRRVEHMVSRKYSNAHYTGKEIPLHSWSQGAIPLYSSRKLALQAMRHELECRYAHELREIDKRIEQEDTQQ